jgi:hypothetical protein
VLTNPNNKRAEYRACILGVLMAIAIMLMGALQQRFRAAFSGPIKQAPQCEMPATGKYCPVRNIDACVQLAGNAQDVLAILWNGEPPGTSTDSGASCASARAEVIRYSVATLDGRYFIPTYCLYSVLLATWLVNLALERAGTTPTPRSSSRRKQLLWCAGAVVAATIALAVLDWNENRATLLLLESATEAANFQASTVQIASLWKWIAAGIWLLSFALSWRRLSLLISGTSRARRLLRLVTSLAILAAVSVTTGVALVCWNVALVVSLSFLAASMGLALVAAAVFAVFALWRPWFRVLQDALVSTAVDNPKSLAEVLTTELNALRLDLFATPAAEQKPAGESGQIDQLKRLYQSIADPRQSSQPLSALCLSGGGIRSATFNLGVIQGLARHGHLGNFDYLSSVSGGGYIASWLRTWMAREGSASVIAQLASRSPANGPLEPEPAPVRSLREYSNYLTPRLGLFSGDTWSAVAIIARNILLNWLVIIPLIASVVGLPQFFLLISNRLFNSQGPSELLVAAVSVEFAASVGVFILRRVVKGDVPQAVIILCAVLPVFAAGLLLSGAGLQLNTFLNGIIAHGDARSLKLLWAFAFLWSVAVPVMGWLIGELAAKLCSKVLLDTEEKRTVSPLYELTALLVSGTAGAALFVGVTLSWFGGLSANLIYYVIAAPPVLLGIYLISRVLFVGISSLSERSLDSAPTGISDDADREWWARLSGWLLLAIFLWAAITSICLLVTYLHEIGPAVWSKTEYVSHVCLVITTAASGLASALLGGSSRTSSGRGPATTTTPTNTLLKVVLAVAAPVFAISVVVLISWGTHALGRALIIDTLFDTDKFLNPDTFHGDRHAGMFFLLLIGLALFSLLAGWIVNVNLFSLHGMYRNRLVRAYLGASNSKRKPDPFTGFALTDNVRLHELWKPEAEKCVTRPLPVINATLNLVGGTRLAWQQRKAESFSMTPFYCGNFREGYRDSRFYGGKAGITVGTAVTISGAAANPNMGYNSSPALGFVMALFNVRLGAWLGNTNEKGEHTYRYAGPRQAIMPMLAELFGLTNSSRGYVNLSDGGHFDNLGLYEMVLRRCRHILVCDAGQDGSFAFEDLGNAIRKIRIDFGIPIIFQKKIRILPNTSRGHGLYCALATICYSEVDGTSGQCDGQLVYIKPTLRGRGPSDEECSIPYDVYSYSRRSENFPHESTTEQWFSESQFESYRALALHTLDQLGLGSGNDASVCAFVAAVEKYLKHVESRGTRVVDSAEELAIDLTELTGQE